MNYSKTIFCCSSALWISLSGCAQEHVQNSITIKRDTYGTPHIFADDNYGLFYGYGYSLAQDRLYQLEILRHSTQGSVAEILGDKYIGFDKTQRTLFWPGDIKKQIGALDTDTKDVFAGFAAGLNDYIQIVQKDKDTLLPLEFSKNGFEPEPWSEYDVVMLFVGSMLLRYGDFNTELDNQFFLAGLTKQHGANAAQAIFDAVLPTDNDFAPTTIPLADWPAKNGGAIIKQQIMSPALMHLPKPKSGHGFSNALVLGPEKLKGAKAVLVNGPQFGWYVPAYTYSAGFHTPSWEAVGNAPLGYPLPMFGYNKNIAWGTTWGASDNVDVFRESLNPDGSNTYKYKGEWKAFEQRAETIKVKYGTDITFTARRSIHGPIIHADSKNGYAYAKRRGWAGRELETLIGWMDATKAKDHKTWIKAVGKSGLNVNWYYADKDGNIGYVSSGAYPIRAKGHDSRLPVSGEGHMDWTGIHPPSWNPQVLNPSSGYIANWNNKPRAGFKNPDEWWYSWSEADRVKVLDIAVANAGVMSPLQAWDLMMNASYEDPNANFFLPHMIAALETSNEHGEIMATLKSWDGRFNTMTKQSTWTNSNNTYTHPGNTIFRAWLGQMLSDVLADDLPGPVGKTLSTATGYGTPKRPTAAGINISVGTKLLYEALQGRGDYDFLNGKTANALWLASLEKAIAKFGAQYGPEIEDWQLPVPATRFNDTNFLGIPQTLPSRERDDMHAMNRGTENNMTVFRDEEFPVGYEIVAPGQSGYLSPQGEASPHYEDQFEMFRTHGKKSTWLSTADIDANLESEITLTYIKP